MCGRYSLTTPGEVIEDALDLEQTLDLEPRTNVCPSEEVLVIVPREMHAATATDPGGGASEPSGPVGNLAVDMRWGLVPRWARRRTGGPGLINARCESLRDRPSFRDSFRRRRCLVPASGYYEWAATGGHGKRPHFFRLEGHEMFTFAALWDHGPAGSADEAMDSVAIVTTAANERVAPYHHRMPVIVDRGQRPQWLGQGPLAEGCEASLFRSPSAAALIVEQLERVPGTQNISETQQKRLF